jgi:hypothetical protein
MSVYVGNLSYEVRDTQAATKHLQGVSADDLNRFIKKQTI